MDGVEMGKDVSPSNNMAQLTINLVYCCTSLSFSGFDFKVFGLD
jgi:hypothetical protein